jgi:hypothetical protein
VGCRDQLITIDGKIAITQIICQDDDDIGQGLVFPGRTGVDPADQYQDG